MSKTLEARGSQMSMMPDDSKLWTVPEVASLGRYVSFI